MSSLEQTLEPEATSADCGETPLPKTKRRRTTNRCAQRKMHCTIYHAVAAVASLSAERNHLCRPLYHTTLYSIEA